MSFIVSFINNDYDYSKNQSPVCLSTITLCLFGIMFWGNQIHCFNAHTCREKHLNS